MMGKKLPMSFADNKTPILWKSFMPAKKEITNAVGKDLYSLQIYPKHFFINFNVNTVFEKWALVEVTDFDHTPPEMEAFELPGGLYAVFEYKGHPSHGAQVFQEILFHHIPSSDYVIDDRPHFEILGENYKRDDPASEETIWIPVRKKIG
jgi:AraC family transcriptional regulator